MFIEKTFFQTLEEKPLKIEAELTLKEQNSYQECAVIILHAHPLMGGNKDFKMLYRLSRELYKVGFDVLRFNFRGVGRSEGSFGEGFGEAHDFEGAYNFMINLGYKKIAACGYSFGSVVGLSQLDNFPICAYSALGFPNAADVHIDIINPLVSIKVPTLFVSGENDDFSDLSQIEDQFQFEIPPEIVNIEDEGHFFTNNWLSLNESVTSFMLKHLK